MGLHTSYTTSPTAPVSTTPYTGFAGSTRCGGSHGWPDTSSLGHPSPLTDSVGSSIIGQKTQVLWLHSVCLHAAYMDSAWWSLGGPLSTDYLRDGSTDSTGTLSRNSVVLDHATQ